MKFLKVLVLFGLFLGCETDEGRELGKEYCKCITEAKGDVLSVGECEDHFKDEIDQIEKKPRIYKNFMEELENCQ